MVVSILFFLNGADLTDLILDPPMHSSMLYDTSRFLLWFLPMHSNHAMFFFERRFPEAVEDMLSELIPNRLTDYLYDLSEKL